MLMETLLGQIIRLNVTIKLLYQTYQTELNKWNIFCGVELYETILLIDQLRIIRPC